MEQQVAGQLFPAFEKMHRGSLDGSNPRTPRSSSPIPIGPNSILAHCSMDAALYQSPSKLQTLSVPGSYAPSSSAQLRSPPLLDIHSQMWKHLTHASISAIASVNQIFIKFTCSWYSQIFQGRCHWPFDILPKLDCRLGHIFHLMHPPSSVTHSSLSFVRLQSTAIFICVRSWRLPTLASHQNHCRNPCALHSGFHHHHHRTPTKGIPRLRPRMSAQEITPVSPLASSEPAGAPNRNE
jgi:hypothetical protein